MYIYGGSSPVNLIGCSFSGNSVTSSGDDIYVRDITANIGGCPAGYSGAAGAALDTYIRSSSGATITGERKSYSCVACVR